MSKSAEIREGPSASPVDLLDHQLLFVTGKGGVGKSTLAAAIAMAAADDGRKTLLCEVDAKGMVARLFTVPPFDGRVEELLPNLYGLTIDTELALREYLKLYMKVPMAGRIGPIARIFDFVATAAPGVREILTIGKIVHEAELIDADGYGPEWDLIVVDASATGHIVGQLNAHRAIREMVRVGLIREQTEWMASVLEDPDRTGVVLVATPEEMPVSETIDLYHRFEEMTAVSVAAVVVNRVLPEIFTRRDEKVFEMTSASAAARAVISEHVGIPADPYVDAAELAVALKRTRSVHLRRLREEIPRPTILIPYLFVGSHGLRTTRLIADALSEEIS